MVVILPECPVIANRIIGKRAYPHRESAEIFGKVFGIPVFICIERHSVSAQIQVFGHGLQTLEHAVSISTGIAMFLDIYGYAQLETASAHHPKQIQCLLHPSTVEPKKYDTLRSLALHAGLSDN